MSKFFQINSSYNLLPFYVNREYQYHRRHHNLRGVPSAVPIVTRGLLPKFQLQVESATIDETTLVWEVYDLDDNLILSLDPLYLNYYRYGTGTIVVFDRNTLSALNVLCGYYYIKVIVDRELYYSEAFQVIDLIDTADFWRITYSGDKDTSDGFIFSKGFEYWTLFKAYLGTSEVRQQPEDIINGRNVAVRKFDSLKRRPVLKIPDCPPYFEHTLRHLELDKLTVKLMNMEQGEEYEITQIELSSEDQSGSAPLKILLLSFEEVNDVYRGTRENLTLTTVYESSSN